MENVYVSYLRVSTERQGASGLGIDAQRSAIQHYVDVCGGMSIAELIEIESGKRSNRPILEEAISLCRRKRATLLVAKLDRLSRTVSFMSRLIETGVDFIAVDNPHANKLMIHVLAAFAEHERDLIAARTRAALASAKDRGARLGNPNLSTARAQAKLTVQLAANEHCENVAPIIRQIRASGVNTLRGIANALATRGIRTARGGQWHPATIRNLEMRFQHLQEG